MSRFPDPLRVRGDIVAIGGDLEVETLIDAYRNGIFPWPTDEMPLPWFSPEDRAVLLFDEIHLSRSLRRTLRSIGFTAFEKPTDGPAAASGRARGNDPAWRCSIDEAFDAVIRRCAQVSRPGQGGTWIFPEVVDAYIRLHEAGFAHSAEVWEGNLLIGGIYGVDAGGAFSGESMFHLRSGASKVALLHLVDHLRRRGVQWLDIQVMTEHMKSLGARLIPRDDFIERLRHAQRGTARLFD